MKVSEQLEHLLKVFYTMYCNDSMVRQYGIFPSELIDESGIDYDDAGDALAIIDRMREQGWIKVLSTRHVGNVRLFDKIQLTEEGIRHVERLERPWLLKHLRDIYVATIEGITRSVMRR